MQFQRKKCKSFNTNTPKETVYGEGNKPSEAKSQKIEIIWDILKDRIIRDIFTLFETEEEERD